MKIKTSDVIAGLALAFIGFVLYKIFVEKVKPVNALKIAWKNIQSKFKEIMDKIKKVNSTDTDIPLSPTEQANKTEDGKGNGLIKASVEMWA